VPVNCPPLPNHIGSLLSRAGLNWVKDVAPIALREEGRLAAEVRMLHDHHMLYAFVYCLGRSANRGPQLAFDHKEKLLKGDPLEANTVVLEVAAGSRPPVQVAYANVAFHPGQQMVRRTELGWMPIQTDGQVLRAAVLPLRSGAGCVYALQVPLAELGLNPNPGEPFAFRMDVTCISNGADGSRIRWSGATEPSKWNELILDPEPVLAGSEGSAVAARVAAPITVDGNDTDWVGAATYAFDDQRATFKIAWDEDRLYALVHVTDPSPLRNRASSPEMIFKGGDAVALVLGPAKNQSDGGAMQKIIVAPLDGEPVVMLYRPRRKGLEERPYIFRSPVSEVTFEHVAPLPGAEVAFKPVKGGYVAEFALPWKTLQYAPAEGRAIPLDVQVIFSDATGNQNAECAWWRSVSAEAHANNDIPTEVKLYPAEWGTLMLQ
jgi:hypothetical protein